MRWVTVEQARARTGGISPAPAAILFGASGTARAEDPIKAMKRLLLALVGASVALGVGFALALRVPAAEPADGKADIDTLMAGWEKAVQEKIARDPELKALAAQYPLVLLHAHRFNTKGSYGRSHYSFVYDSSDEAVTRGSGQILFDDTPQDNSFDIFKVNTAIDQQNLVADLGAVDFTEDPDPRAVDINGDGQHTWVDWCNAIEGHVYLERVRDWKGHLFYVVFKVIAADKKRSRYMAFLWRRLPWPRGVQHPRPTEPYPNQYREPMSAAEKAKVREGLSEWGKAVRARVAQDPRLRVLAAKYPLVLMYDRFYTSGGYGPSAYSFVYETADEKKHHNDVQIEFMGSGLRPDFDVNMMGESQNLVADLGKVDFTQDADPRKVNINGDGQQTWMADNTTAVEGHVYLERVKDIYGTRFYVLFQVIAVEPGQYMAFVWRRLPGGKVVEPPWAKP